MIGDERDNLRMNAWIRGGKKNGFFVRPRLFMPYYEEIKVINYSKLSSILNLLTGVLLIDTDEIYFTLLAISPWWRSKWSKRLT